MAPRKKPASNPAPEVEEVGGDDPEFQVSHGKELQTSHIPDVQRAITSMQQANSNHQLLNFQPLSADVMQQLLAGGNAELVAAMQAGLMGLIGNSSGYIESLPAPVKTRVEYLKELQQAYDDLEEAMQKEIAAIEAKYTALESTSVFHPFGFQGGCCPHLSSFFPSYFYIY